MNKNFLQFKKITESKLNAIREHKVSKLILPENAWGFTGNVGSYSAAPFAIDSYYFTIWAKKPEIIKDLGKKISDSDIFTDTTIIIDNVMPLYRITTYVNMNNKEAAEALIKEVINSKPAPKAFKPSDLKLKK